MMFDLPRKMVLRSLGLVAGFLAGVGSAKGDFMAFVLVGDAGNAPDSTGYGGVAYAYQIGEYEVTNAQYAQFLNAVAAIDKLDLYNPSMGSDAQGGILRSGASGSYTYTLKLGFDSKPVNFVSYYDSLRFINWMTNGLGGGGTENGSYTLLGNSGVPTNASTLSRNPGALFVMPSEDEWYKAAYYQGNSTYSLYPTGANSVPASMGPNNTTANSANYGNGAGGVTDVGAYSLSGSHYGTFDQAGNVIEKDEATISGQKGSRGGSWRLSATFLAASTRDYDAPTGEFSDIGFRVALVPEPATLGMLASGLLVFGFRRRLK
jgi:sulfatase modifying factor 1